MILQKMIWRKTKFAAAGVAAALALQGCGGVGTAVSGTGSSAAVAVRVQGNVHGGQQPISNSTIQLYAVNPSIAKGASNGLILANVLTDADGRFTITDLYTCPAGAQVYLLASGGDPGAGTNTSIELMAGLGSCAALKANAATTFITINELTTIASVYALAPFMADATHVGASAATLQGLTNAFDTEQVLANTSNGSVPGPKLAANVVAPSDKLALLANAMAACVNSPTGSTECNKFFAAATPPGGSAPTDTVTALLNIVHYPANNVDPIFHLVTPNAPFPTSLTSAPQDWTMPLKVSGGGLISPYGLAVDGAGNVWAANEAGFSVSKFNYLGSAVSNADGFTAGGLLAPQGIAVDLNGNVWVANTGGGTVVKLDTNGNALSADGYTDGVNGPVGIAVDKSGNAWVANFDGDSITQLGTTGSVLKALPGATGSAPVSIALDVDGNVWIDNNGTGTVAKYSGAGAAVAGSPYTDGYLQGGAQIAVTSADNAWVAAPGNSTLSAFAADGSALPASPVTGGGLSAPAGVAVDGSNAIWVANGGTAGTLSEFTAAGTAVTPASGIGSANAPVGIAIDGSGNVWTANSGDDTLTEFVGLGSPVVTPLAAAIH